MVLACFFLLIVTVNDRVDKYGILHGGHYERQMAEIWQEGKAIAGYDENTLDERQIVSLYLTESEKKDCIVLGSSRCLQMTKDYAPADKSFFNAGVSGLDFRDLCNFYYQLEQQDKLPDTLILVLDPWLLHNSPDTVSGRSDANLYHKFLALDLGLPVPYEEENTEARREALFSLNTFQENIAYLFRDRAGEKVPVAAEEGFAQQDIQVRLADGSQLYPLSYRTRPQEEVEYDGLATILNPFFRVEDFARLDDELKMQFEALVDRMQQDGMELIFVLVPYHPTTYEIATQQSQRFPAFFEVEPYYRSMAAERGIPVYGSYDPLVTGCRHEDFYDGLHIRREALPLVFPGLDGSEIYRQHLETEEKIKAALQKMQQLQLEGKEEPWMEELSAYVERPAEPRMPVTP